MAAGRYSFTIDQGATVDFDIIYKSPTGTRIDLTGYTASMQIKNSAGGNITYASLTGSSGNIPIKAVSGSYISLRGSDLVTSPTSGSLGIYLGHAITNNFNFGEASYDLELTNGPEKTRLLQGQIQLNKQVTTI